MDFKIMESTYLVIWFRVIMRDFKSIKRVDIYLERLNVNFDEWIY